MKKSYKYLKWIDDGSLFAAIEHIYNTFKKAFDNINLKKVNNNIVDPFLQVFDLSLTEGKSLETWLESEIKRQTQKTINNSIGDFHQKILGSATGWCDLGHNHPTGLDVCNIEKTIFAEIKNRDGTITGSNLNSVFYKLEKTANEYEESTVYLAQIISKSKQPYDERWEFTAKGKKYSHPRVRRISGQNFYNIVGGENALENLFDVLPNAIDSFMSTHEKFKEEENHVADELRLIIGKDLDINQGFKYFFEKAYKY